MPMSARTISGLSAAILATASSPSLAVSTCTSSPEEVSSMTRCILTLSSARSSFFEFMPLNANPGPRVPRDEIHNLLHRCAGQENPFDADRIQLRDVHVRNNAADHDQHVVETLFAQQLHHPRADVHMGAGQNRQADGIRVLLQRRRDNLLGSLPETRIDHFHPGVPQGPGDDLGTAVVAVKSRFGNDYADFLGHVSRQSAVGTRQSWPRDRWSLPTA